MTRYAVYQGRYIPFQEPTSEPLAIIDGSKDDHLQQVKQLAKERGIPLSELYSVTLFDEIPKKRRRKK